MESPEKSSQKVPPKKPSDFITKLYGIMQDKRLQHIIGWSGQNNEIEIKSQRLMETLLLPAFFRHGKLDSFIRQLNNYGFTKVTRIKNKHNNRLFFRNEFFRPSDSETLKLITRRTKAQEKLMDLGLVKQSMAELHHQFKLLARNHPEHIHQIQRIQQLIQKIVPLDSANNSNNNNNNPTIVNSTTSFVAPSCEIPPVKTEYEQNSFAELMRRSVISLVRENDAYKNLLETVKEMPNMSLNNCDIIEEDEECSFGEKVEERE